MGFSNLQDVLLLSKMYTVPIWVVATLLAFVGLSEMG